MHACLDKGTIPLSGMCQVAKLDNDSTSAVTRPNAPAPAKAAAPPASVYNPAVPSGYERFFKTFAPEALAEQAAPASAGQAGAGRLDASRAAGAAKQTSLTSLLGRLQPREPSPVFPPVSVAIAPTDQARVLDDGAQPFSATCGNARADVHHAEDPSICPSEGVDASVPAIAVRPAENPESGVYSTASAGQNMGQQSRRAQGSEAFEFPGGLQCEFQHGTAREAVGAADAGMFAACSGEGDVGKVHATYPQSAFKRTSSLLDMRDATSWPGQGAFAGAGAAAEELETAGEMGWSDDWDFLGDDQDRASSCSREGLSPGPSQLFASPTDASVLYVKEVPTHGGLNSFHLGGAAQRLQTEKREGVILREEPVPKQIAASTHAREGDRPHGRLHEGKVDNVAGEREEGCAQRRAEDAMPAGSGQSVVWPARAAEDTGLPQSTEGYIHYAPKGHMPGALTRLADMSAAEFARLPLQVQRTLLDAEPPSALARAETASAVGRAGPGCLGGFLETECTVDPEYGTSEPPAERAAVVSLHTSERAAEDRLKAASAGLPHASQIDTSVLDALPLPLKRELERAHGKFAAPRMSFVCGRLIPMWDELCRGQLV